nr:hypothetical protein [Desulfobacterales bacterium]
MRTNQEKRYQIISLLLQFPDSVLLDSIPELESCLEQIPWPHAKNRVTEFLGYLKSQPLI